MRAKPSALARTAVRLSPAFSPGDPDVAAEAKRPSARLRTGAVNVLRAQGIFRARRVHAHFPDPAVSAVNAGPVTAKRCRQLIQRR